MGGNVFMHSAAEGHPSLKTPRMDPKTYQTLKEQYTQLLWTSLPNSRSIATAMDAPGKPDYGDIDIIVISDHDVDWAKVAAEVGAVAWVNRGTDDKPNCSLAVHIDGSRSIHSPVKYIQTSDNHPLQLKPSSEIDDKDYAQIDVVKIGSALEDWTGFYSSYGDLAGMLGRIVTNFGFDITETGLRLRLKEWDDSSLEEWKHFNPRKDEGKMMLSADPDEVMNFFGLNVKRYRESFHTKEEIFQWLSESELACHECIERERTVAPSREEKKTDRSMFNEFLKVWLPAHLKARKAASSTPERATEEVSRTSVSKLREQYLEAALSRFDKQNEYTALHQNLLHKRGIATAEDRLRPIVATHSRKQKSALAEMVRAFRRNVEFRDGEPHILPSQRQDSESLLHTFLDQTGRELQDKEAVDKWVQVHFDTVKDVERKRMEEQKKRTASAAGLN
ncbi:hypothetical protein MBLNU13_g02201t1 [Cladosporium sp. NU13]